MGLGAQVVDEPFFYQITFKTIKIIELTYERSSMKMSLVYSLALSLCFIASTSMAALPSEYDAEQIILFGDEDHDHDDHGHDHDDHDHDDHDDHHGDDFDMEDFDMVLEGKDLADEACFIGLLHQEEGEEDQLMVVTSFDHEGEGPGILSLTLNGEQTKLVGKSEEGSIVIALKAGETDLIAAESFVVSWEHEGHTDTGYCQNLKVLKKPNPES